jgi:hypothetical protein
MKISSAGSTATAGFLLALSILFLRIGVSVGRELSDFEERALQKFEDWDIEMEHALRKLKEKDDEDEDDKGLERKYKSKKTPAPTPAPYDCNLCLKKSVPFRNKRFPDQDVTCGELEDLLALATTEDDCNTLYFGFPSDFDPGVYCECKGEDDTGLCDFCPKGFEVSNPNLVTGDRRCSEWEFLSRATISDDMCDLIQLNQSPVCCTKKECCGH